MKDWDWIGLDLSDRNWSLILVCVWFGWLCIRYGTYLVDKLYFVIVVWGWDICRYLGIYICILSNGIYIIMVAGQEERSVGRSVGRFLPTRRTELKISYLVVSLQ